jgi:hypothetical protein
MCLVDFGLAEVAREGEELMEWAGTIEFMAPEILSESPYGKKVGSSNRPGIHQFGHAQ